MKYVVTVRIENYDGATTCFFYHMLDNHGKFYSPQLSNSTCSRKEFAYLTLCSAQSCGTKVEEHEEHKISSKAILQAAENLNEHNNHKQKVVAKQLLMLTFAH
jgi:hypothetical protein